MNKRLITAFILMFTGSAVFAQLTGSKSIPGNYPTIQSAIADLNAQGAGTGGVTFNIAADHKEEFTTPLAGYVTTTTGSSGSPIIFQKSGTGSNPVITAATGSGAMDAIIAVAGCDYVTFDGITLQENMNNYDDATWMEWGFAILKASGTNGSQHITIKNCKVDLYVYYEATTGIYAANHTPATTAPLSVSAVTGANSYLKIYRNTIGNCYSGIKLTGYNDPLAPYALYDQNNEIGVDGGDTITNVGGGSTAAYGIYAKYQNQLKVANNKVTSTMQGEQPHYGIHLTTSLNASYELYGNYVSMTFYGSGGAASFYPVYCDMGGNGTNNTVHVYSNTVTGCNYPTADHGNQATYYMYLNNMGVTANVHDNVVSNNTVGAADVSAPGRIWYLACNMATLIPGSLNLYNNSITGNARIQVSPGGGLTNFLMANGNGNSLNLHHNAVTDNLAASNSGTNVIYALMNAVTKNVYDNIIRNISGAEGAVYGLYYATSSTGTGNVYRNTIQNITGVTQGSYIYGIYHAYGNQTNYYNNMVSDLKVLNATTTSAFVNQLNGIAISQGNDIGLYNNSVCLTSPAPGSGGNCGSSALYMNSTVSADMRNNILVNTSVPSGSGRTAAFRILGSAGVDFISQLTNYNALFAGTPDPVNVIFSWYDNSALIYHDDVTMSDYKNRMFPRELQSVTELPPFVNLTTAPYDIHLKNNVPTQCEAGGTAIYTPVAVATDFDNEPRFPGTGYPVNGAFTPNAPDIGADEFGGLPNDLTAPAIAYTPLLNTNSGSSRTLTATITDGSGVPVSGSGLPMLYWKVNTGSYLGVQGQNVAGSTYSFTFGGGVVIGDIVSYYIVAQDNAPIPNVGASPFGGAGGYTYNPPACYTPPGTPSSYTILLGISGIFHVGTGKDFNTLTAAAGLINQRILTGPVTLVLDDAAYPSETFPVTFNANPGSGEINTLTVKPNTGMSPIVSTDAGTGVLILNGIDHFILDGSNNGTNSKDLKIAHTSTTAGYSYALMVQNYGGKDPATNITVKNCTLQCTPVHSSVMGRFPLLFSFTGGGYDNCIIDNNLIIGGFDGIRLEGAPTGIIHNTQITNNIIGSVTDSMSTITRTGISTEYADNTLISGNDIMGPYTGSLNAGMTGIYISTGSTNTKIRKNKIHEIYNNNPDDGWGASGITYYSDASTVTEISNNLIYDIKGGGSAPGLAGTNPYGILIQRGGNLKILSNTISLTGPYLSSLHDASSACIGIHHNVADNSLEIQNNILRNSMVCNGAPNLMGKAYGIILDGQPTVFSLTDHNDYFIDGYQGQIGQQFLQSGIIDFQTLAIWQTFTGQEANSVVTDPEFTSPPVLLPASVPLNNRGTYHTMVPADITGALRNNPPDIGAYEFGADPLVVTTAANTIQSTSAQVTGSVNPAGNTVSTFFDYGKTTVYGTSVSATPATASGSTTTGFQASLPGLESATVYHYRARTVTTTGLISYGADSLFTTLPAAVIPELITVIGGISNDTCFNATQTISLAGTPNTFVVTPSGHVTLIAGQNILFLPGATVQAGGYLLGYITTTEDYCGSTAAPVVAVKSNEEEKPAGVSPYSMKVYPNPTTGDFTLMINHKTEAVKAIVEVFNMHGNKVEELELTVSGKNELSLSGKPSGIYLVRVISGSNTAAARIIKL